MSFIECTARSMSPANRASSSSLVNRPLPPASISGRSVILSPVVLMMTSSHCSGVRPCAAPKRAATCRAWASAKGEPRVPMRIFAACKPFSPGARRLVLVLALCGAINARAGPRTQTRCRQHNPWQIQSKRAASRTSCSGLRRAATRRPRPSCCASRTARAASCPTSCARSGSEHRAYGGVVPEIAARAHVECLDVLVREAMREADAGFADLDGVAATAGPGLIGGLIVGADHRQGDCAGARLAVRRRATTSRRTRSRWG